MGAGNNVGIKNTSKDFTLILNPDVILEKKQDLLKKKVKLEEELRLFDRLYENYIFKIMKLINEEKKLVVKNRKFLEMHPDILKNIMTSIVQKESKFRNILKQI